MALVEWGSKGVSPLFDHYMGEWGSKGVSPLFDHYMGEWLKSGLIRDQQDLSIEMTNNPASYDDCFNQLLKPVDPKSQGYVNFGTRNNRIFKAIYISKLNHNGVDHVGVFQKLNKIK
jgi:hypothetical protein